MQYRQLGNSSLTLPVLTYGTYQLGDSAHWTPENPPEDVVRAALDHGITCFDCAESYADGESEAVVGRALGKDRARAILASKVSQENLAPARVIAACEGSLRRLRTETIDLYQVHWPNPAIPFAETYGALERLRQAGKIREFGVSNFGPQDLRDWLRTGSAVSNQMCYNALFRAIEFELLPECLRHQIGMLAYSPLMNGILSGRWLTVDDLPGDRRSKRIFAVGNDESLTRSTAAEVTRILQGLAALAGECGHTVSEVAMGWLLAQPGVTSIIFGGSTPGQIAQNARAADIQLDSGMLARIDRLTAPLKQIVGPNADPWLDGAKSRVR